MADFFTNPFYMLMLGLGLGMGLAGLIFVRSLLAKRELKAEIESLKEHLHTQMKINAKGNESLQKELDDAKRQIDNLKSAVAALKTEPSKAEVHALHVFDKAVHIMNEKAPGFAPAWENAMREAEHHVEESETGVRAFIRKVFRPALNPAPAAKDQVELMGADPDADGDERPQR